MYPYQLELGRYCPLHRLKTLFPHFCRSDLNKTDSPLLLRISLGVLLLLKHCPTFLVTLCTPGENFIQNNADTMVNGYRLVAEKFDE